MILPSSSALAGDGSPAEVPTCRDPGDDVVLATARAGECVAIVTGDQALLILDPFHGIRLLTPSAFLEVGI